MTQNRDDFNGRLVSIGDVLHTIKNVAEILNVSKGTVRNLISRRELMPVRISDRVVRIPQSELDNYIRVVRDDFHQH